MMEIVVAVVCLAVFYSVYRVAAKKIAARKAADAQKPVAKPDDYVIDHEK